MKFRLVNSRRAAGLTIRHGLIAALAAIVVAAFVALAALTAIERRADAARDMRQEAAIAANAAHAILEQQQGLLDRLAATAAAADAPNAAIRQLAGLAPSLLPGLRAAALFDPTGAVVARSGALAAAMIAGLGGEAAAAALATPGAALLITAPKDDLVGLARAWFAADGAIGGVALIAIDRAAFAGFDILRRDGISLFGGSPVGPGFRQAEIAGFPLIVRYQPPPQALVPRALWAILGVSAIGLGATLAVAALLIRRRRQATREATRRDRVEAGLRDELAKLAATVDRTDETNRSKSRFFAQVTHELRTPLNAILGFSETIRQEMFGPVDNPRYREYAGLIHDAGSHLLSLINDLLDSARIEAGKMEIAPIRMSAAALARSALDLVELSAEARGITLAPTSVTSCPDLNVDPRAFKQVLVNLLSNAIKFTLPGGRIDVDFTAGAAGGVTITVADTGIGMSAEDVRLAFEPFGRGGGDRARLQEGSGLGLSLARALVRLHGGELTLASRLDAGTTAIITLPASAAFAAEPRLAAAESGTAAAQAA